MTRNALITLAALGTCLSISCGGKEDAASGDSGATGEEDAPGDEDEGDDDGGGEDFDPTSVNNRTYAVELGSATFVQPAGVGAIIGSILEQSILLGVTGVDDTSIDMMGALSNVDDPLQDFCNPTVDFPTADFSDAPYFQIGPADTTLGVAGASVTIADFQIGGDFVADATSFNNGLLTGQIDLREMLQIEAVEQLGGDADALCELVDTLSSGDAVCEACSDGVAYCLQVEVVDIVAFESNQILEVVESCDPSRCDEGCR